MDQKSIPDPSMSAMLILLYRKRSCAHFSKLVVLSIESPLVLINRVVIRKGKHSNGHCHFHFSVSFMLCQLHLFCSFAFVEFDNAAALQNALLLNDTELKGRQIKVCFFSQPCMRHYSGRFRMWRHCLVFLLLFCSGCTQTHQYAQFGCRRCMLLSAASCVSVCAIHWFFVRFAPQSSMPRSRGPRSSGPYVSSIPSAAAMNYGPAGIDPNLFSYAGMQPTAAPGALGYGYGPIMPARGFSYQPTRPGQGRGYQPYPGLH